MNVYVADFAQVIKYELIKERLQSFLVKNNRGHKRVVWKQKTYQGCFGYSLYATQKSFLCKESAIIAAKEQAKAFIDHHETALYKVNTKLDLLNKI